MKQPGHDKHEGYEATARHLFHMWVKNEPHEAKLERLASAQVAATLAVYHALVMQHAGTGPSVAEMASDR